jgi:uncharacterized phage-associated protein
MTTAVANKLSCYDVAKYFLWVANKQNASISNLKLQKLVYYAQAWHLAINGQELFAEDFQAWVHGPVIPELYNEYKRFEWMPIQNEIEDDRIIFEFTDGTLSLLQEVTEQYFACDVYDLERMTHAEAPWQTARDSIPADVPSTAIIDKGLMQEYYGAKASEENSEDATSATPRH